MKKFYFLSGLPRSGSTLLTAILNQNPKIYSSPTSGLIEIMGATLRSWYEKVNEVQGRNDEELFRLLKGILESKYENIDKPIIIDKSRGWPNPEIIRTMSRLLGTQMKIIATVRSVPDCATSFLRIVKPKDKENFLKNSQLIGHLKNSYLTLHQGYTTYPDSILMVDYDDLLSNPKREMDRIHKFLEIDEFEYSFENIDGTIVKERDEEVWNIPNLHDIKPKLKRQHSEDSKEILGHLYDEFDQEKFWIKDFKKEKKINLLDQQYELSLKGKFDESWEIVKELEIKEPNNNRAAFNRGWFLMKQGKLLEGHKLLNRGRIEKVFGNNDIATDKPLWDGKTKGTVLLILEGGLGDQINCVRYVKDIRSKGCKVIVACSKNLIPIFKDLKDITTIVQLNSYFGVHHDFYVPSMSAVLCLEYEYENISGKPYIDKLKQKKNKKFRIGLRWKGNPNFQHEEHREFPSKLLFDSVKDFDVEFVSLQKDEGSEFKPEWVEKVNLDTWIDTKREISKCDLVISSCTSVAHLSGAMGVPTWIIVPILPYYLWALPGEKTPYYDSVRLFRQEVYGNWSEPFEKINQELKKLLCGEKNEKIKYLSI
jgi:hypothetical protein